MARSILDIVIKLTKQGRADQETVKGLVQVKSAIMEAAAVAGTLVAAGYTIKKAFDATVGTFVAYADQVRSVAQLSGLSAQESSRLIQVADDLKISFEDLQKVMQKNGDQYDYSVNGLAAMSDQYIKLETSQEKAAYMQERFGKSWGNFVELMEQGSSRIQAAGEGINDALILDQKALNQAREYEKQVDTLNDSWMAFKVTLGTQALPAVNNVLEGLNNTNAIREKANRLLEDGIARNREEALSLAATSLQYGGLVEAADQAYSARMNGLASLYATADATDAVATATENAAEAAKAASEANQTFLSLLGSSQSTYEKFEENNKKLTEERMQLEAEKQSLLAQGYSEQSQQVQEVNAKLEENKNKTTEVADQFELDNKRIILGYLERQLTADGTLTDAELNWLLEKGVAWGIYSQTVVDETRKAMNEANALINGFITEKTFTLSLNTIYSTYGDTAAVVGQTGKGARRAHGTDGWETVPSGFPNDSYPVWMTSGEKYAVMPTGGGNVSTAGGGGYAGGVNLTVNINSMINTADREKVRSEMLPVIQDAVRSLQAQGML